jgi:transcriptional regulator with XRE-family HTH domain
MIKQQDGVQLQLHIGRLLREARRKANKTQQEVADEINMQQSRLSEVERGFHNITLGTLSALAAAVGCRVVVDFASIRKSR